jgi:hypothetical protein
MKISRAFALVGPKVKAEDKINTLRRIVKWYKSILNAVDQDGIILRVAPPWAKAGAGRH